MRTKWPLLLGVCLLALPVSALADGVILNGVSARTIGRGGTNIGFYDNGSVLFDNPAGAVNMPEEELLEAGATLLLTDFEYSDPDNPSVGDRGAVPLPNFSYIRKSCDDCWAYGVGVFAPAGFSEKYVMNGPAPFFPGPQTYKSFGSLGKILPAVACRVTDRLSAGATLGVAISHAELEGPYFIQDPPLIGLPTLLDVQATGAAICWSFGLQYELSDCTTVGATYQNESRFTLDGTTRVTLPPQLGGASSSYDTELDITWPESLGVGVRHDLSCCRTVSCDVIWFNWSDAFDSFALRLTNPTTPGFPPTITDRLPLQWRDTVSLRLGYEQVLATGGTLRLGYVHHRNPIPAATLTPYIQATLENGVSVGYGWCWGQWDLDVAYMYTTAPDVNVGVSGLVGGDFSLSRHGAETHAIAVGAIRRY